MHWYIRVVHIEFFHPHSVKKLKPASVLFALQLTHILLETHKKLNIIFVNSVCFVLPNEVQRCENKNTKNSGMPNSKRVELTSCCNIWQTIVV